MLLDIKQRKIKPVLMMNVTSNYVFNFVICIGYEMSLLQIMPKALGENMALKKTERMRYGIT